MIAVVQRVSRAHLIINENCHSAIEIGMVILLGVGKDDNESDIEYLIKKLIPLRIFSDVDGKMNLSSTDVNGDFMIISQFTLMANTKKGNRPSFEKAAPPDVARDLYQKFIERFELAWGKKPKTGIFAANMKVDLINDGPVTLILDSKNLT